MMEEKKYTQWFWILNFGFLFFRLLYIGLPQLAPQEAYYWNYSRHLALSYFDHPPLHAWLIWLATRLGTSEFTVRLFAPLFAFGTAYFCFLAGKSLFNARVAFYFALTLNAILIFNIGSVILTPDVPLLFFWTLSLYLFAKIITEGKKKYWYPLGICLGLSMLSKYTAIFIPISIVVFLLLSKDHRFWFVRKEPYIAVILSLLAFSPVLIWNAQNGWASFAFQTSRRAGELGGISLRDFFAYLGSQIGVVSPLIYGVMIYAMLRIGVELLKKMRFFAIAQNDRGPDPTPTLPFRGGSKRSSEASSDATKEFKNSTSPQPSPLRRGEVKEIYLFLFSWAVPIILFFTLVSFKYWVKINWPTPGYVPAILAGVALFLNGYNDYERTGKDPVLRKKRKRWLVLTSLAVGFIFVLTGYASPFLPVSLGKGEAVYGWKELALTVEGVRQKMDADNPIIIGYEYKTASELAFYLPDRPETFSNNFVAEKGLSYDFWSNPNEYKERNAIFVFDQRARYKNPEQLQKFFERVEQEPELNVAKRGKKVTTFHIFRCYGYKGRAGS
jgi:4-amino-4-deoxy-L-arabinose transferase-like glycosyltransferase